MLTKADPICGLGCIHSYKNNRLLFRLIWGAAEVAFIHYMAGFGKLTRFLNILYPHKFLIKVIKHSLCTNFHFKRLWSFLFHSVPYSRNDFQLLTSVNMNSYCQNNNVHYYLIKVIKRIYENCKEKLRKFL